MSLMIRISSKFGSKKTSKVKKGDYYHAYFSSIYIEDLNSFQTRNMQKSMISLLSYGTATNKNSSYRQVISKLLLFLRLLTSPTNSLWWWSSDNFILLFIMIATIFRTLYTHECYFFLGLILVYFCLVFKSWGKFRGFFGIFQM